MNKLITWISALGQNVQWIAFWAHFGVAALIVEHVNHREHDPLYVLTVVMILAAVKEFYYDAKYEKNPSQTFIDNLEDWLGWCLGGLFGFGFAVGWW